MLIGKDILSPDRLMVHGNSNLITFLFVSIKVISRIVLGVIHRSRVICHREIVTLSRLSNQTQSND